MPCAAVKLQGRAAAAAGDAAAGQAAHAQAHACAARGDEALEHLLCAAALACRYMQHLGGCFVHPVVGRSGLAGAPSAAQDGPFSHGGLALSRFEGTDC